MDPEIDSKMYEMIRMVFMTSRIFDHIMNRELIKDGITMKQFQVLAAVDMCDDPPKISEVAENLATTHQNVKQIANQLERRGFISIDRDPDDRRALRLRTTDRNREFWSSRSRVHDDAVREMFSFLGDRELSDLHSSMEKLMAHTTELYKKSRNE